MRRKEYIAGMVNLTIKIPADVKQRLEREAQQSGRSVSDLIREAVGDHLRKAAATTSLYERTRDLCGVGGSGRPDLATNREHLRGFGE
jgi:Arc/MetJ-type ribon-helix-helix transcriptional regulator